MRPLYATLLAGVAGLALFGAQPSYAQEAPTQTWNSSETFRSASDRSVDVAAAEAQKRARQGGDGPASATVNYNGPVNNYTDQTYNGPSSSATSVNAVNWTTNSSSVNGNNGSQATIVYTTGSLSYSAQQGADSNVANTGAGNNSIAGTNSSNGTIAGTSTNTNH